MLYPSVTNVRPGGPILVAENPSGWFHAAGRRQQETMGNLRDRVVRSYSGRPHSRVAPLEIRIVRPPPGYDGLNPS